MSQGKIRIIGGDWRGRKLPVPTAADLRPTADRIRETLFNWLAWEIAGQRCLDLYAGTGALGFEAASRGAAQVSLVEKNSRIAQHLQQQVQQLTAENIQIHCSDALRFLQTTPVAPFNVVFLDPPFSQDLLTPSIAALQQRGWLHNPAWIYIERAAQGKTLALPTTWTLEREKTAGQVTYALARYCAE